MEQYRSSGVEGIDRLFGERVRHAREAVGLSQTEVADRMGVSPQGVQKWESGASFPRLSRLYRLAEVLTVPLSQLLPDNPEALPAVNVEAVRARFLAERIARLPEEKVRALSVILEVAL